MNKVRMAPDGSVRWEQHEVASHQGNLFLPPESTIGSELLRFATMTDDELLDHESIGWGQHADVFRSDNIAFKVFKTHLWGIQSPEHLERWIGLGGLRANVILQRGLLRLRMKGETFTDEGHTIDISGQAMLGGFVSTAEGSPDATSGPTNSRAVWASLYEPGIPGKKYQGSLPFQRELNCYYDRAVELCGAAPEEFYYDSERKNQIVRTESDGETIQALVKVDTMPRYNESFTS